MEESDQIGHMDTLVCLVGNRTMILSFYSTHYINEKEKIFPAVTREWRLCMLMQCKENSKQHRSIYLFSTTKYSVEYMTQSIFSELKVYLERIPPPKWLIFSIVL